MIEAIPDLLEIEDIPGSRAILVQWEHPGSVVNLVSKEDLVTMVLDAMVHRGSPDRRDLLERIFRGHRDDRVSGESLVNLVSFVVPMTEEF